MMLPTAALMVRAGFLVAQCCSMPVGFHLVGARGGHAGSNCGRRGYGLGDVIRDPSQIWFKSDGYSDAQFFCVVDADGASLGVQSFGDQEQGVHLGGGVVLRVQGFARVLKEGFLPDIAILSAIFRNAQVLFECVASIGHSPTVRAAAVVCTEMRPIRRMHVCGTRSRFALVLVVFCIGANAPPFPGGSSSRRRPPSG